MIKLLINSFHSRLLFELFTSCSSITINIINLRLTEININLLVRPFNLPHITAQYYRLCFLQSLKIFF